MTDVPDSVHANGELRVAALTVDEVTLTTRKDMTLDIMRKTARSANPTRRTRPESELRDSRR